MRASKRGALLRRFFTSLLEYCYFCLQKGGGVLYWVTKTGNPKKGTLFERGYFIWEGVLFWGVSCWGALQPTRGGYGWVGPEGKPWPAPRAAAGRPVGGTGALRDIASGGRQRLRAGKKASGWTFPSPAVRSGLVKAKLSWQKKSTHKISNVEYFLHCLSYAPCPSK